jgi:hypothetical protein
MTHMSHMLAYAYLVYVYSFREQQLYISDFHHHECVAEISFIKKGNNIVQVLCNCYKQTIYSARYN